jgi:hypothetical protein
MEAPTRGFSCCKARSVLKKRRCIGVMTVILMQHVLDLNGPGSSEICLRMVKVIYVNKRVSTNNINYAKSSNMLDLQSRKD